MVKALYQLQVISTPIYGMPNPFITIRTTGERFELY